MSSTTVVVAFLAHLGHIGASLQPTTSCKFRLSSKANPESQWVGVHTVHLQGCHSTECTPQGSNGECVRGAEMATSSAFPASQSLPDDSLCFQPWTVSYLPHLLLPSFDLCSLFSVIPWGPVLIGPLQYLPRTSSTYVLKLRVPSLHSKSCIIFPVAFPKLISLLRPTLTSVPPDFLSPWFSLAVPSVWKATLSISTHHKPVLSSKLTQIFPGISCFEITIDLGL